MGSNPLMPLINLLNKMKQSKTKYLNLTNSDWKAQKQWNKVGMKITKTKLTKPEKIANTIAAVNVIIPATAWPVTSPIIIKIGQRISRNSKVKLR